MVLCGIALVALPATAMLIIRELGRREEQARGQLIALVQANHRAMMDTIASSRLAESELQEKLLALVGVHYQSLGKQQAAIQAMGAEQFEFPQPRSPEEQDLDYAADVAQGLANSLGGGAFTAGDFDPSVDEIAGLAETDSE